MAMTKDEMNAACEKVADHLSEIRKLFPGSAGVMLLVRRSDENSDFVMTTDPYEVSIAVLQGMVATGHPLASGELTLNRIRR